MAKGPFIDQVQALPLRQVQIRKRQIGRGQPRTGAALGQGIRLPDAMAVLAARGSRWAAMAAPLQAGVYQLITTLPLPPLAAAVIVPVPPKRLLDPPPPLLAVPEPPP